MGKQPSEIGRVAGLVLMVLAFLLLMLVVVLLRSHRSSSARSRLSPAPRTFSGPPTR